MVKPEKKKYNLKTTTNYAGKEVIRFREKITKKSKVLQSLQARDLNQLKLAKKRAQKNKDLVRGEIDIPVDGERIADLKCMAKKMFCVECCEKLTLSDIVAENIQGLGSTFDLKCPKCQEITQVNSSEKYVNKKTGRKVFVINSKVALGKFISLFINTVKKLHEKITSLPLLILSCLY